MTYSTDNTKPLCDSCRYWVDYVGCMIKNSHQERRKKVTACDKYPDWKELK